MLPLFFAACSAGLIGAPLASYAVGHAAYASPYAVGHAAYTPVVRSYAPAVYSAPIVKHVAPVAYSAPIVKTVRIIYMRCI